MPCIEQGFLPDCISTDLHRASSLTPNAKMLPTMSKFLNMGLSLSRVIELSTVAPARLIERPDLGALSVGAEADVAVLSLEEGDFGFVDSGGAGMRGNSTWPPRPRPRPSWDCSRARFPSVCGTGR